MNRFGSEFKVGLFTIAAAAVIAYMFFVLSPDSFRRTGQRRFYTEVKNAAGIVNKTHVKTNGVVIGKVVGLSLLANRTRIDFEVQDHVQLPLGSQIGIKEKGLLGDVFLEIVRSEDSGQYYKEGELIPALEGQFNIGALVEIAGSVGKDIKEVTAVLAKLLGGAEGEKTLHGLLSDVRALAADTRALVAENRTDLRATVQNLQAISVSLREIVGDENRHKIANILTAFDKTMQDFEVTAKSVRVVADKIEKGEGTIGKLVNDEMVLNDLQAAINDVREVLAPATKLQLTVDYHGEIRKDQTFQHYFNTYLRTRPDRFYLLGFTDMHESTRETLVERLDVGEPSYDAELEPSPYKTRERVVEKKAIRFNVQFGTRWHFAQLRFGLFESTGGIASDLLLLDDQLRLSLEAFDWNTNSRLRRVAHLKAYLSVLFFKHIYGVVGIDDLTRYDLDTGKQIKAPNTFFGAGLNFDDQDLKALFGAASLAL